jgi:hypothetical protein
VTYAFSRQIRKPVSIAPLVTFRVAFGAMMLFSIIRFWYNGWITELYVKPKIYFPYHGFEWIHPAGSTGMHIVFLLMGIAALCVAIGCCYRVAITAFFLLFTYVELIDITNYLNHYYFISIVSFLMIWLPANRSMAIDTWIRPSLQRTHVPLWTVGVIRLQLAIVYFFAGLAKLNADWLFDAMPMRIWLPAKTHLPIIGPLMYQTWVAYVFSWFGACYDLFIPFFLIQKRTRPVAYFFVVSFHVATAVFFPGIGMFPYVMILSSLVFFSGRFHERLQQAVTFGRAQRGITQRTYRYSAWAQPVLLGFAGLYFLLQILLPLRFLLYPGHLFWHEEGFRFSWRVMLMEKSGNSFFYVKEPATGKTYEVNNSEFLTPLQEKMMSTQPDMLLYYAHFLAKEYARRGIRQPAVYVEDYVALNGQRSRLFIDSTADLAKQQWSWKHYDWVLPYKN